MLKSILVAIGFLLVSVAGNADVYVWRDAKGVLNYSDTLPPAGARDVKILRVPGQKGVSGGTIRAETRQQGPATAGGAATGSRRSAPSAPTTAAGGAPSSGGAGGAGGGGGAGGVAGGGGGGGAAGGGKSAPGGGTTAGGGGTAAGGDTSTSGGTTTAGGDTSTSGGTTTAGGDTSTSGGTTTAGGDTPTSGGTTTAGGDTPTSGGTTTAGGDTPTSGGTITAGGDTPTSGGTITASGGTSTPCANPAGGYEGFGRNTTGGAGKPVYRVTNLNDSGSGSLRDAIAQGNRCVVFDVAGTISLSSALLARGANITIDGFTAPAPGISLTNWGFDWHGPNRGVANIIARGLRIRGTVYPEDLGADGFQIVGVNNFVIDHVSIDQWGDGSIDIASSSNGTVQWSIFGKGKGDSPKSMLIKYKTTRISLHHNLFINSLDRHPYIAWTDNAAETPTEIVADVRNNLVWNYGWTGISVRHRSWANVVNNYLFSSVPLASDAIHALYVIEEGVAYANGNYSPTGLNINAMGNRATPFPATVPTTTDAVTAAHQVVSQAGARGPKFSLDSADLNYIGQILLTPLQ
ncbi:MAG TPA: DUF4124 domain-containing protein [Burkholderiales bacterium]|nr:DUF4124 domain-containing protein [Burkholderiales bacterium]